MYSLQWVFRSAASLFLLVLLSACAASPQARSTGEYIDDKGISAKVKTALVKEPNLKSTQINVETYNGVVQLSGFVDSSDTIRKAGEVATGVSGVKSVINNLVVRGAEPAR